jgi:hypothetical protein
MQIENRKHWIDQIMDNVSDYELTAMFADLTEFRRTALLKPESPVRALDRIFRKQCGQSDTMLRVVEDAVLYEMARRYNNANEDNRAAAIERWKTQGFREVLLYKDEASTPILTYWVFADNADNLTLGHFDSEEAAREFIRQNGYTYGNDGSVIIASDEGGAEDE